VSAATGEKSGEMGPAAPTRRLIGRLCGTGTAICAAMVLPALFALRIAGERAAILGGLLYLPHLIWASPFIALAALSAFAARRWMLPNAVIAAAICLFYPQFAWNGGAGRADATLVVATNNVGQSNRQSPRAFLESGSPDVVLFQEGLGGARLLGDGFSDYFRESRGEFRILSKHPILSGTLVRVGDRRYPVAARFELAVEGRRTAIYNVHLPTPRGDLLRLFSARSVGEIIEPPRQSGRKSVRGAMRDRVRLATELAAIFAAEKLPMIAAGDFNMPSNGYLRRMFTGDYYDAFGSVGFGYGFTFPGFTRNPFAWFGPWLRLDYIFSSRDWKPAFVRVESGRGSQHRAVLAGFTLERGEGRAP
jgi:endonuclease/exonuclease/phosphatase (EEP) superfamily protein YafD